MLPTISNLQALADILGMPKFMLTRYVFQSDYHYKTFRIPKRSRRGHRTISSPSPQMKGIQRWILVFILRKLKLPDCCTGFRQRKSIVDNARQHVGKEFVLNLDIKDFFPTISRRRVFGLFRSMGYTNEVSFAFSRLVTFKEALPQGAPTSPYLANAICRHLDARLLGLCSKRDWTYTRYADDITISGSGHVSGLIPVAHRIIEDEGFRINRRKQRILRRGTSQIVTGLSVNDTVRVPRRRRKMLRAIFHQAKINPEQYKSRRSELSGHVSFLRMIRPDDPTLPGFEEVLSLLQDDVT